MKKIFAGALLGFCFAASAQMKEGRIVYEKVSQLPIRSFNIDPEIAKQIPKSRTEQFELLFANNQSLYQFLPDADSDGDGATFQSGGMVLRIAGGANDVSFHDFANAKRVDRKEIMERSYIVSDSIRKNDWKLSDETKTILNYTCHKATTTRIITRSQISMENGEIKRTPTQDTSTVVAWYTTNIPVSAGPDFQGQLPGTILELDIADRQTTYRAIEISPKVNANKIKAPKDGKKLTSSEFEKEREKLMEEMRKNMGGNERIKIQQ